MDTDKLAEWAATEQLNLWDDLRLQIRLAVNGRWSMGAASVAARIGACAKIIGPASWREVPWELWAGDVYSTLHHIAGVTLPEPDAAQVAESVDAMVRHQASNSLYLCRRRMAGTVAAMLADRDLRDALRS